PEVTGAGRQARAGERMGRRRPWRLALALAASLLAPAAARAQRPEELKGSPDKLARQNEVADSLDLSRMGSATEIRRLVKSGYLVSIPRRGRGYYLDRRIGKGYARREVLYYARPWVRSFLVREGEHYADRFRGARFKVSSLIRTETYQEILKGRNVNAARGDDEDTRSPHLTGSAVDISKKGMSARQLAWMRDHLVQLQESGWIIGTEEMATNTFHVFVNPTFGKSADASSDTAKPKAGASSRRRHRTRR
ncbi:MAG TPA: DUF5715 family protein, partial [Longimicrobiales bacterium]